MFIEVPTTTRGLINVNTNNITHVFTQGDDCFFEMVSKNELELDTSLMTHEEFLLALNDSG